MPKIITDVFGKPLRRVVNGHDGKPLILNPEEQAACDWSESQIRNRSGRRIGNALGFEIDITTMTAIARKIVQQSYYEIEPAEYLPIIAGQGAWSTNVETVREFVTGDSFESGITNLSQANARISEVDAAVDGVNLPIYNWNKRASWTIMQIQHAAKVGNWDYGEALQKARKKNYDLGIQRVAFLGANGFVNALSNCYGLLNLPNVYTDTTVFTAAGNVAISKMPLANLNTFASTLVSMYRVNCNRSAWPTDFYVPEDDFIAMGGSQFSPTFPIGTIGEILLKAFKSSVPNGKFGAIKPISYAMVSFSGGTLSNNAYVLLNKNDETLNMQLPVPYSTTVPNSLDNFQLQDVAYAQFTGVQALKPREIIYFNSGYSS